MVGPTSTCGSCITSGTHAPAQPDTLREVQEAWPGRETEAATLWEHVSRRSGGKVVFIHGGAAAGKTGVVRAVLEGSKVSSAYVNAVETAKERQVLQLIIEQLRGPKKREIAPEGGVMYPDFMVEMEGLFPWGDRRTAWVVLDNVERLSASIMAPLLSLARHTCAAINWVLISREAPMPGSPFMEGLPPDIPTRLTLLHFSPYTIPQLAQVIQTWQPPTARDAQRQLEAELVSLVRLSRSPEDQQQAIVDLHARLAAGGGNTTSVRPTAAAQPARAGSSRRQQSEISAQGARRRPSTAGSFASGFAPPDPGCSSGQSPAAETYELPNFAKVLLVAAYVASRTRDSMDRTTFDPSARRKRRRKSLAHDKQTEQAHLEELKGRRNFGRERLLAIFWSLLDAHLLQQEDGADGFTTAAAPVASREQQSAAVLGHLAGLAAVRMLLQVQENGLLATKYTCDIPDAVVQQLAQQLRLDLRTYVQ